MSNKNKSCLKSGLVPDFAQMDARPGCHFGEVGILLKHGSGPQAFEGSAELTLGSDLKRRQLNPDLLRLSQALFNFTIAEMDGQLVKVFPASFSGHTCSNQCMFVVFKLNKTNWPSVCISVF